MKKLLLTIAGVMVVIVIAAAIALYKPWTLLFDIPIISPGTALTVNLIRGKAEVYLDDKKVGETPFSSEDLDPGDHTLELKRMSADPDFYDSISKLIHLESNTRTLIEAEIGPDEQFTSYKVVYYRSKSSGGASVYIATNPPGASVSMDNLGYGESPVATDALSSGKHEIEVTKPGYKTENATFIVRDGFTLIAEFDLMAQPIDLQSE